MAEYRKGFESLSEKTDFAKTGDKTVVSGCSKVEIHKNPLA